MTIEELTKELEEIKAWKASLEASWSIPLNIDQAFRARFGALALTSSSKSATSENKAVDEGGVATYSVMDKPDAFLQVIVDGGIKYIPIFT